MCPKIGKSHILCEEAIFQYFYKFAKYFRNKMEFSTEFAVLSLVSAQ